MNFHVLKNFVPQEFLPPSIFNRYGAAGLMCMDSRMLWTLDELRERLGPITINTYHLGGTLSQRGFRDDPELLEKTPLSQHRFGRACDFTFKNVTPEIFREMVKYGDLQKEMQYITRVEADVEWCHIDCAPVLNSEITFF